MSFSALHEPCSICSIDYSPVTTPIANGIILRVNICHTFVPRYATVVKTVYFLYKKSKFESLGKQYIIDMWLKSNNLEWCMDLRLYVRNV